MSSLLDAPPFSERDDAAFLASMCELTRWHLDGCPDYRRIWPTWTDACSIEQLPFVHVGVFKRRMLQTDHPSLEHQRVLLSSATTHHASSRIALDETSSKLQSASSLAILREFVGPVVRPLLILDDARSLRRRNEVSARIAAAMSLRPLSSEIVFLFNKEHGEAQIDFDLLRSMLDRHNAFLVYGVTSTLWFSWAQASMPDDIRERLRRTTIHFVHSGGWKRLEAHRVDREQLERALLRDVAPASAVVDCYGLVEQVGLLFVLCEQGHRHVPVWADVLVRDPWTLQSLPEQPGMLQFMNVLAHGAPYHNVLTEDYGRIIPGDCPCGRRGRRFELLGRIPRAEVRGCGNV